MTLFINSLNRNISYIYIVVLDRNRIAMIWVIFFIFFFISINTGIVQNTMKDFLKIVDRDRTVLFFLID